MTSRVGDEGAMQVDQPRHVCRTRADRKAGGRDDAKDDARRLGLLLDLPLCRYSWCLLLDHQIAMSVWQPQV